MCPHILRYLAAAVIVNRSRRSILKDLVKVIQQVRIKIIFFLNLYIRILKQKFLYIFVLIMKI